MKKKKAAASKARKSVRDLPSRTLNAKTAKGVKGGSGKGGPAKKGSSETPTESVGFTFGQIEYKY